MSVITIYDLRNGYVELVDQLVRYGRPVESRGLPTREQVGVTIEVLDPTRTLLPLGVGRGVNVRLAAVEALQLLSGTGDVELLQRASPNYTEVLVDPSYADYGAYGPRLRYQLESLVTILRREPTTRRAVLTIWREQDLTHVGDRPCTLTVQLLVRDDRLHLLVSMRSQDVWLGVPYDLFMFTQLQRSVAAQLGVDVGRYTHHVGSLHVYERDVEAAGRLTRVPDDLPTPVGYPAGVVVSEGSTASFVDVARRLVTGCASDDEAAANPWYVRQLAGIGVGHEVPRP